MASLQGAGLLGLHYSSAQLNTVAIQYACPTTIPSDRLKPLDISRRLAKFTARGTCVTCFMPLPGKLRRTQVYTRLDRLKRERLGQMLSRSTSTERRSTAATMEKTRLRFKLTKSDLKGMRMFCSAPHCLGCRRDQLFTGHQLEPSMWEESVGDCWSAPGQG